MWKGLKTYCKKEELDKPMSWRIGLWHRYAVSLHLIGKDKWGEYDVNVVFLMDRRNKKYKQRKECKLLDKILNKLDAPIVLTLPESMTKLRKDILKRHGLLLMPVRWSVDDTGVDEYEVYMMGQMEMGGYANLMEQLKYIGSKLIYYENKPSRNSLFRFFPGRMLNLTNHKKTIVKLCLIDDSNYR